MSLEDILNLHPSHRAEVRRVLRKLVPMVVLLAVLVLVPTPLMVRGLAGYEPLHALLETVSIVVAGLVFAVVWNAPSKNLPGSLVLLACAFAGVGLLDFSHMLSIQGMPAYVTPSDAEKAINFWLAARLLGALALLGAALLPTQGVQSNAARYAMLLGVLALVAGVHWLVLWHADLIPRTFVRGQGLTLFKRGSEYLLIGIDLAAALALCWRMRSPLRFHAPLLLGAALSMAMSEVFMTLYGDITDLYLVAGHVYKVVADVFLFQAVFVATIGQPYRELEALQMRLKATLEAVPDLIFEMDTHGRYLSCHSPPGDVLALSAEQLVGRTVDELLPRKAAATSMQALRDAQLHGVSRGHEIMLNLPVGRRWFELSVARKPVVGGETQRLIVVSRDITERHAARQALQESQMRFQAVLDYSPALISIKDLQGTVILANRNFEVLDAPPLHELVGRNVFDLFPRDIAQALWDNDQAAVQADALIKVEEVVAHKDGTQHTYLTLKFPVRDTSGAVFGICAISTDITERKAAERALQDSLKEKVALLNEVHHRVKNNLQVITSLLRLEAGRSAVADTKVVLGEMQGRIRSMALLHESLYRSGTFASVDLGHYLRQLATQAFRAAAGANVHLVVDVEPVAVSMDVATPCGLLVNELISNCLKHGFPMGRSGEVRLELHRSGPLAPVCLCVRDNGVGLGADFAQRSGKSLGLQLVTDLARQIGSEIEVDPGPGAAFTLRFTPHA